MPDQPTKEMLLDDHIFAEAFLTASMGRWTPRQRGILAARLLETTDLLDRALSATCHHNDPKTGGMGYAKGECDEPWRHNHHAAALLEWLRDIPEETPHG